MIYFSSILNHQYRAGGPRYVRLGGDIDRELDFGDVGGGLGGGGFNPSSSSVSAPLPTPITNAEELAGGLTTAQVDQAAQMEVEEGVPISIDYGERLKAGTLVSHLYEPGIPQNTFTVILGEGWGGLGRHGEWEGIVKAWYLGEELTKRFDYTVWFNDRLPKGATPVDADDGWNWVQKDPAPFFGKYSHQSPNKSGVHQHYFEFATQGLAIASGDTISTWIWIDPTNPPQEIMVQFHIGGDLEHRAYLGANLINLGTNGTNSRRQISASIPPTGQWIRFDVPADGAGGVGLGGATINGMSFTLFDGSVTWGQVSRWKNDMPGNSGYIFRPGIITPLASDVVQDQDLATWPAGLAYSGSANVTVRLGSPQADQDRPDGFKCRVKCRRVLDFDATGAEILDNYGYSPNPARVAADRILHFYEQRYRTNPDLAREKFRARVFWPSWVEWRDYCDQFIPWDHDGDGTNIFIRRFEAHIGFNADISLAHAIDQITGLSATMWQDDGSQLIFLPPSPRAPIHHFHPGNIVGGISISVTDLRRRFNRFIALFRDTDDPFLGAAAVEPPEFTPEWERRQRAIARVRERRSEREFANMTQSQASRVITYRAQLEFHNPVTYALVGNATAFKVLPGDFVTISHPEIERPFQLCLVTGIRKRSVQSSADEIGFLLQRIDGTLYDDSAHRARQEALEL
jgi:hypothetical protein